MRLGGPQNRYGCGEEKNSQPLPGLEPPIIQPITQQQTQMTITAVFCFLSSDKKTDWGCLRTGCWRKYLVEGWRRLRNEGLHNLYVSPDIIRVMKSRWGEIGGAWSTHGRGEIHTKCFSQNRIPRNIWEDNIKIELRKIRWEGVDWIHLDQDRHRWRALVNTVMNLRVP
jgi:hypothetical protein